MCPVCLAGLAMMVVGVTSTGGLAAVVAGKFRRGAKQNASAFRDMKEKQTKEKQ
jgi:hypothetical protein